jgi:hypothetical protein
MRGERWSKLRRRSGNLRQIPEDSGLTFGNSGVPWVDFVRSCSIAIVQYPNRRALRSFIHCFHLSWILRGYRRRVVERSTALASYEFNLTALNNPICGQNITNMGLWLYVQHVPLKRVYSRLRKSRRIRFVDQIETGHCSPCRRIALGLTLCQDLHRIRELSCKVGSRVFSQFRHRLKPVGWF